MIERPRPELERQAGADRPAGEAMPPPEETPRGGRDLGGALRRARMLEAEHAGVVVDVRAGELARLEALRDEVEGIVAQVPQAHRILFEGGLVPGFPPRLWVDILSFVEMAHDRRTYVFQRDTREGRVVLAESADVSEIADRITDHIAFRIIERERAIAEDSGVLPPRVTEPDPLPRARPLLPAVPPQPVPPPAPEPERAPPPFAAPDPAPPEPPAPEPPPLPRPEPGASPFLPVVHPAVVARPPETPRPAPAPEPAPERPAAPSPAPQARGWTGATPPPETRQLEGWGAAPLGRAEDAREGGRGRRLAGYLSGLLTGGLVAALLAAVWLMLGRGQH